MALTQISTAGVKDDAVTSGKIPANAVGTSELADNAVVTAKLAGSAVSTGAIADNAVTTAKIAGSAVSTGAIADQAVTLAKLEHGTSSNDGKFLRANNGADPTFETVTSTTINNNADNRVITGSGTANTLEGEANLTYDGTKLNLAGSNEADLLQLNTGNSAGNTFASIRGDNEAGIRIRGGGSERGGEIELGGGTRNTDPAVIKFSTNTSTSFQERMRIDSSGRVIIGSTSTIGNTYSNNFTISEANGNAGMQIEGVNGNTGYASIYFGDAGHRQRHYIESQLGTNGHLSIGTIGTGPILFGNSSGTKIRVTTDGLCFNSDTAAANALDDYEEGAWTATCVNGGTGINNDSSNNRYVKIGSMVFLTFEVSGLSNPDGNAFEIGGIPYAVATGREGTGSCMSLYVTYGTNRTMLTTYAYASQSKFRFYSSGNATSWRAITGSDFSTSGSVIGSLAYHTV